MTSCAGMTIGQIIHDFATTRGDLTDPRARDDLAAILERRAAAVRAEAAAADDDLLALAEVGLGRREAACGCCWIVDMVGMRDRDAALATNAKAEAWNEGHRFTGYEPERGENPYLAALANPAASQPTHTTEEPKP